MDKDARLKLAVQKSGRLTDPSVDLLVRCGLKLSRGKDQLIGYGENMPLDLLFVRDDDIPDLVQEDVSDLGLVGLNVSRKGDWSSKPEGRARNSRRCETSISGVAGCRSRCPTPAISTDLASLSGKRIATTYPFLLGKYLRDHDVQAQIVTLSGAVEIAPRLGRADADLRSGIQRLHAACQQAA